MHRPQRVIGLLENIQYVLWNKEKEGNNLTRSRRAEDFICYTFGMKKGEVGKQQKDQESTPTQTCLDSV